MTLGEDRIGIKFNPSDNSQMSQIKQKSAELINLCEELRLVGEDSPEKNRCLALAQTAYEDAAMWAVRAAKFG